MPLIPNIEYFILLIFGFYLNGKNRGEYESGFISHDVEAMFAQSIVSRHLFFCCASTIGENSHPPPNHPPIHSPTHPLLPTQSPAVAARPQIERRALEDAHRREQQLKAARARMERADADARWLRDEAKRAVREARRAKEEAGMQAEDDRYVCVCDAVIRSFLTVV